MRRASVWLSILALLVSLHAGAAASPQPSDPASCDDVLLPLREVMGRKVGPASCLQLESAVTLAARPFVRLDLGLNGTVEGYLTRTGDYKEYLTNAPDLVYGQTADPGPRYLAVAAYERDKGAAMTVVFPRDASAWNGRMWVTVHGRGASFKQGNLKAWNKNLDPADPLADLNKYDRLMLAKGYALAKTRRTSAEGLGEILATLENGSIVDDAAFNDSASYIKEFTEVAERVLARRLGRAPARTYFYGHSAGGRIGRGLNYTPGLNTSRSGAVLFDGFLLDDAAAGGWLPIVMKDGSDVLFATGAQRSAFVPQFDITHQMYNNLWPSKKAPFMSESYLANKRRNARVLRDKGLTDRHRMYEVRGISHSGGESLRDGRRGELQILDLSKLMDRFVDMLDAWVADGTAPPPTRSDWPVLGDADRDGTIEHPALALPEVACPLGVYYPYPNSKSGTTAFAPFSGEGLEPLDGAGVFVDMNRNGVWDDRETPTQAWRRLGLLPRGDALTRAAYTACVRKAVEDLSLSGFVSARTAAEYEEAARRTELEPRAGSL